MFRGADSLTVLEFKAQYTLQFSDLGLSKNEAYINLRVFLSPPALDLFNSAKASAREGDGV